MRAKMNSLKLLYLVCIILFIDSVISVSEQCVQNDELCGYSNDTNVLSSCCGDEYICVTTEPARGAYCAECPIIVYPYKCLKCAGSFNGHCGGPHKIECCPMSGYCVLTNFSDPNSLGRCVPPP